MCLTGGGAGWGDGVMGGGWWLNMASGGMYGLGVNTNIPANEHHVDRHDIFSSCSGTKIHLQGSTMPLMWYKC